MSPERVRVRVEEELLAFHRLRDELGREGPWRVESVDGHGFILRKPGWAGREGFDLLVSGLIHGDEVIGLEVINRILRRVLSGEWGPELEIGFLLCNVEAARAGKRFLETDLNRSFCVPSPRSFEEARAVEVGRIASRARFVLDLHQTVQPTESPFFVFESDRAMIRLAHQLLPEIPIVIFDAEGFSLAGKTLLEHASVAGVPALVMECGQNGFSEELAAKVEKLVFDLVERLVRPSVVAVSGTLQVHQLGTFIPNRGDSRLVPGLINYMAVQAGQLLGYDGDSPILSPIDGRLFFPKYGELAKVSPELCEIGKAVEVALE